MRVSIADASAPQLLRFLQVRLGQQGLKPNTGRDKLVAKIAELWTEDFIEVEADAPNAGDAGPKKDRPHYGKPPTKSVDPLRTGVLDPMVTIRIHSDRQRGGDRNVPCHVNGVEYYIPRGKPVQIPYRNFLALEEAVGEIHDGWDDKERRNSDARETQSYTYTVLKTPTETEIEKWKDLMEPYLERQRQQKMRRIVRTRQLREEGAYA